MDIFNNNKFINRAIMSVDNEHKLECLELVERVFTEYENEQEGKMVRSLVEEIRGKKYYVPELELMAIDDNNKVVGYAMFSRFHIENKYEDELLILTPVAVETRYQRQHISKDLLEYGFDVAKKMGYSVILVEGDPRNYNSRGFVTSKDYGIVAGENIHLPMVDCLMVKELKEGVLKDMHGIVDYSYYDVLSVSDVNNHKKVFR